MTNITITEDLRDLRQYICVEKKVIKCRQYQLVEGQLWTIGIDSKPPCSCANSRHSNITSDRQVTEEQPSIDQRLFSTTWRFVHDLQVWRVKTTQHNTSVH